MIAILGCSRCCMTGATVFDRSIGAGLSTAVAGPDLLEIGVTAGLYTFLPILIDSDLNRPGEVMLRWSAGLGSALKTSSCSFRSTAVSSIFMDLCLCILLCRRSRSEGLFSSSVKSFSNITLYLSNDGSTRSRSNFGVRGELPLSSVMDRGESFLRSSPDTERSTDCLRALNIGENPISWIAEGERILTGVLSPEKDAKSACARASNLAIPRVIDGVRLCDLGLLPRSGDASGGWQFNALGAAGLRTSGRCGSCGS